MTEFFDEMIDFFVFKLIVLNSSTVKGGMRNNNEETFVAIDNPTNIEMFMTNDRVLIFLSTNNNEK